MMPLVAVLLLLVAMAALVVWPFVAANVAAVPANELPTDGWAGAPAATPAAAGAGSVGAGSVGAGSVAAGAVSPSSVSAPTIPGAVATPGASLGPVASSPTDLRALVESAIATRKSELASTAICSRCQAPTAAEDSFCRKCGTRLA